MEEHQQRRLETIRTCLNNLEKYFVRSEVTSLITDAQLQIDKLLSADSPAGESAEVVQPISPNEAAKAFAERCKEFPQELLRWINQKIVNEFDLSTNSSTVLTLGAPTPNDGMSWVTLSALHIVYRGRGWAVTQKSPNVFAFSKRDEKQASSIN